MIHPGVARGKRYYMATDVEIERALATVTATLNDQKVEHLDPQRVQEMVTQALGGESKLRIDDGGGIHDETGTRVGAIRRTDSGEWIADRQNDAAEHSDTAIPSQPPQGKLRALLTKMKVLSG
jgi:hypothetical protein